MKNIQIEKNRYVDSVTLMGISQRAMALKGITNAEAGMATPANQALLREMGYFIPEDATVNDLMLAITSDDEEGFQAAIALMLGTLSHGSGGAVTYHDLTEIDLTKDRFDLVQISLPGEFAVKEAEKALHMGLDVFIFSDNISLEQELMLKQLGQKMDRLVMGPDCGVGLMKKVALGAGSIVKPGPIGIIGASGSGAQEVACIVEHLGLGVSSLIGTGGHDLYPEIGGITMKMALKRLHDDPETAVIVLVSKQADLRVMDEVLTLADGLKKPVVAVFLGSSEALFLNHCVHGVFSLEDAALKAVELFTGHPPAFGITDAQINAIAKKEAAKYTSAQKFFRGLYCGGTFTEESLIYFNRHNKNVALFSNLKTPYAKQLPDPYQSAAHTVLDLGAGPFIDKAPHPVFDPALRLKRFKQEVADPQVAVVAIDFILGPGLHPDPVSDFCEVCKEELERRNGAITFVCTVCGAQGDPQNIDACRQKLTQSGAIVLDSNAQSASLVSSLISLLEGGE